MQGVGYRYFAEKQARALGLSGYAKNLADGGVEVLAQGESEALGRFISMLKIGPSAAEVAEVTVEWSEQAPKHERLGFEAY